MLLSSSNEGVLNMTSHRFKKLTSLILLAAFVSACSSAPDQDDGTDVDTSGAELDAESIAEIQALADAAVAAGIPGVSVAIVRGAQVTTFARGLADQATGEQLSPAYRLRMASMAKSLVASVVLQLADEGRLKLSDPLDHWLPGRFPAHAQVPLELLLRQESGLFDFAADERYSIPLFAGELDHAWKPDELLAMAAEHPPNFPAGERFQYSNTNFLVLAVIVEQITGRSLQTVMKERIFDPLGMSSSHMATSSELPAPFAHGYMLGLGAPLDATAFSGSAVFGCGNIVSVPLDMAKFYGALVAGKVVDRQLLPLMFSKDPSVARTDYTMGLFRWERGGDFIGCDTFVGHDGGIPGFDSVAYSSLDGKRQLAIAVNSFTVDEKAGDERAQLAFGRLIDAAACR
jgi:D-alanyl-D-alanine carboxypeptidase